jgi:hypothetical protein
MGERRSVYRVLVGKPEEKSDHLGDPGLNGGDNIKMDLQGVKCGMDWIELA